MRHLILLIFSLLAFNSIEAQPKWAKQAAKSVFTLKTFNADGILIGSTNGFFVNEDGEAISSFSPFVGASRAVAFNSKGKEMPVEYILGANETYDVVKLRIKSKDITPLSIYEDTLSVGSSLWLLAYSTQKNTNCIKAEISKIEKFNENYHYYTLSLPQQENNVACPLLDDDGRVVGLLQPASHEGMELSYAVSARFANGLSINGLSINDATLKKTKVKIDLPEQSDQAILTLYIAQQTKDSVEYANIIERFIEKFPNIADGYIARAQLQTISHKYAEAETDMDKAINVAEKKDDVHYQYARLIYNKVLNDSNTTYDRWTFNKAAEETDKAYSINPVPLYMQFKAQIRFSQKHYDDAFGIYKQLTDKGHRTAEIFLEAAQCKRMLRDTTAMIALIDSAVNTFNKPYLKEAAPYILARAQTLLSMGEYRKAVADFNEYEKLLPTQVNANFYYIRSQAEIRGRLYQQALNDLQRAASMNPNEILYLAEKASLEVRVGLYDNAIETAQECITLHPNASDGFLFLGLAQCLKGNKTEGAVNLNKAKELGDEQAQDLIEKYCK